MNIISIMGRLTADPELKTTQNGTAVCSFTVAVDRDYGDKQTDFISIVAWRQTAEFVSRYFGKGRMIAVSGNLQSRKWEDKDGNKRTAWEVIANHVWFCGDKPAESYTGTAAEQTSQADDFAPMPYDDLPFN